MIKLSEVIRIWRRGTGQSLREASKEIGISVSTLDRLELGKQQVGGGRDGQQHQGQKPVQAGNGLDGKTLARLLCWLLSEQTTDKGR